jgi:hypothetical protein
MENVSVPLMFLMGSHWLPLPATSPMQSVAVTSNRNWQAVHILVADCPCSELVATHLATRGASSELNERVWLVGGDAPWAQTLEQCGLRVRHEDANRLAPEYGIHGGPWLQLISPAGTLAYSGGYAPQRATLPMAAGRKTVKVPTGPDIPMLEPGSQESAKGELKT